MLEITNLNINLQSLLDIIGLIQGITLGILLLILNYKHYRSTFFLGLFLLLFSLKLAVFIPKGLNLDQVYPELFLLPFNFSWLLFPLFFIYTQKVSIFSNQKTKYWVVVPGIISVLLLFIADPIRQNWKLRKVFGTNFFLLSWEYATHGPLVFGI